MIMEKMEIDFNNPHRGSQMLKVACNLNKCKWSIMMDQMMQNVLMVDVSVFISLNTIFADWMRLCGETCIPSDVTGEEIAANIFEVVAHYKRFFTEKCQAQSVKTYIYYSRNWQRHRHMPLHIQLIQPECKENVREALKLLDTVCKYIPGLYFIDTEKLHPGVIPYSIISQIREKNQIDKIHQYRSLIVSKDEIDYTALGIRGIDNDNMKTFVFRRKMQYLLTRENIYDQYFFKHRKNKPKIPGPFERHYPYVMMACAKQMSLFRDCELDFLDKFKTMYMDIINHYKPVPGYETESIPVDAALYKMIMNNEALKTMYLILSLQNEYNDNILRIQNTQVIWMNDRIDYSIDALNENYFRKFKIDFKSLF